jgi:hypothetical protein
MVEAGQTAGQHRDGAVQAAEPEQAVIARPWAPRTDGKQAILSNERPTVVEHKAQPAEPAAFSFSSALRDVIAGCKNDQEVIKERQAAIKARLDNAAALHGIDPAAVRRLLQRAKKNEIDLDRDDEIDTIYEIIAKGGVPVRPSRSDSELDRVLALTHTDKPPTIEKIKEAIGCSQGKAQKLRKSAVARLQAKSSSSREIAEHEHLTEQDGKSSGPRVGEPQTGQIESGEGEAAAPLPNELEIGDLAEPQKGAEDDGLEIPKFLRRPLPARMVKP